MISSTFYTVHGAEKGAITILLAAFSKTNRFSSVGFRKKKPINILRD